MNSLYICPPHLYTVATLPWEIQKVIFQQYYSYIFQIIYIISEEGLLFITPENVTPLPSKMHNIFIWLKVCCIPPNIGGSENNLLWSVANGMSDKQHYGKCSKWPPSAQIHVSGLFCQWSVVSSTMLCWNSAHVATRRFHNSSVLQIGTYYALRNENDVHFTRQCGDVFQVWWVME